MSLNAVRKILIETLSVFMEPAEQNNAQNKLDITKNNKVETMICQQMVNAIKKKALWLPMREIHVVFTCKIW